MRAGALTSLAGCCLAAEALLGCADNGEARASGAGAGAAATAGTSAIANGPTAVRRARLDESFVELTVGDAAFQFRAVVERSNGFVDTVPVRVLALEDTAVARIVGSTVQPVGVGQTAAQVEVTPGLTLRGVVHVSELVFSDSVWLARAQVRAWELRPGWYRITVDAKAAPGEPQRLELAADLICVPDARGPKETIVCRVRQNTRVLLRHTGAGRNEGASLAVVTILRTPR